MTEAEVLRAAKAKIEDPKHWCQGSYACDANGSGTYGRNPRAHSWCAIGSVIAVDSGISVLQHLDKAAKEYGYISVDGLNDHSNHVQVMKMYDRAIEFAEEE